MYWVSYVGECFCSSEMHGKVFKDEMSKAENSSWMVEGGKNVYKEIEQMRQNVKSGDSRGTANKYSV